MLDNTSDDQLVKSPLEELMSPPYNPIQPVALLDCGDRLNECLCYKNVTDCFYMTFILVKYVKLAYAHSTYLEKSMVSPLFVGRETELAELKRHTQKNIASLIVVKGRRRIGKSRLIEQFCQDYRHYIFAGLTPTKNTTKQSQLHEFANQLGQAFGISGISATDWSALFSRAN